MNKIAVSTSISESINKVWDYYTHSNPIVNRNFVEA